MGGTPVWVLELVMPAGARARWRCASPGASRAAASRTRGPVAPGAALAIPAAFALGLVPDRLARSAWPMAAADPGGARRSARRCSWRWRALALFFFFRDGLPVTAVTAEVYRLISSPTLPAIPLLTACGYVLAESQASLRLLRFFKSLLGWMPGGLAVIVIAVCALFTTFTGGSGITVIAIGGLVLPMLLEGRLPRGLLARPRDRGGQPRAALPAEPAGHPLQRGGRARASTTSPPTRCTWPASCPGS